MMATSLFGFGILSLIVTMFAGMFGFNNRAMNLPFMFFAGAAVARYLGLG